MQLHAKRVVGAALASVACIVLVICYLHSHGSTCSKLECRFMRRDVIILQNIPTITVAAPNTTTLNSNDDGELMEEIPIQFIFHQGMDSAGGNIVRNNTIGEQEFDIDELMMECVRMGVGRCVGFTTDGSLKHYIQPYNNWTHHNDEGGGLYTLDTDYCTLSKGHHCIVGTCLNTFNGTYSCLSNAKNNISLEEKNNKTVWNTFDTMANQQMQKDYSSYIHMAVSVDVTVLDGLVAMVQSVIEHTGNNDVMIYIVVNSTNRQTVRNRISCSLSIPKNVEVMYKVFDLPEDISKLIKINGGTKYLSNSANFARLFFGRLFPKLSHVLYLDIDLLVQHDISELWKEIVDHNHLLTVVPRGNKQCTKYFTKSMINVYWERYHKSLVNMTCTGFNAGVVGFNLDKWRKNKIFDEVKYWMGENLKQELWALGTQPILRAVSIDDVKLVDKRWNYGNLGIYGVPMDKVIQAYIVHWNGRDKPWGVRMGRETEQRKRSTRFYDHLWKTYFREVCSGKGTCVQDEATGHPVCICDKHHEGKHCEKQ